MQIWEGATYVLLGLQNVVKDANFPFPLDVQKFSASWSFAPDPLTKGCAPGF